MGGTLTVECHSGFTFAERPTALTWDGIHLEIAEIISEVRTPGGRRFQVKVKDGRIFRLEYDEMNDDWKIIEA